MTCALGPSMVHLVGSAIFYLLLILTAMVALVVVGVPARTVGIFVLVVIAVLAISLQQSLANLAATVSFLLFQPFRRGELVETMGQVGTVQEILLFNTVLLLPDDCLVTLPNSKIQEGGVINYSRQSHVVATITLTVAYRENQDRRILTSPPVLVVADDLGDHGVRIAVFPSVRPRHYWDVRFDLRERIKTRFDAEGIAFAVPPRDLRLSGIDLQDARNHAPR